MRDVHIKYPVIIIKQLIAVARENNDEVVYVQHDDGPGSDLDKATDNYEVYEDFAEQKYSYYLLDNMFTPPEGKKFKCWCTKPETSSGVTRRVGYEYSSYYNKTDTDIYAIWENE